MLDGLVGRVADVVAAPALIAAANGLDAAVSELDTGLRGIVDAFRAQTVHVEGDGDVSLAEAAERLVGELGVDDEGRGVVLLTAIYIVSRLAEEVRRRVSGAGVRPGGEAGAT